MQKKNRGFTLVELMIVVAIIGILAATAWPAYQRYIQSANRSAAQSFMMGIASKEEQYMLENRSYAVDNWVSQLQMDTDLKANPAVNDNYTITVAAQAGQSNTYKISAVAKGSMAGTDTLSLDSKGEKLPADLWE